MADPQHQSPQEAVRWQTLRRIETVLELPMVVLGFVWLLLLVVELVWGLNPLLTGLGGLIWLLFILDFLLEFTLAPRKAPYLRRNWLTAIALVIPALRVFRAFAAFRALRFARSIRLVRLLASFNRGMRALGTTLGRRGFGYVAGLTAIVLLVGAAGIFTFEREVDGQGFDSFWTALWWTSMMLLTLGTDFWPQSSEGRLLSVFLALYAFTMLGYVTATLASFFIGRDAESESAEIASASSLRAIHAELRQLRKELQRLNGKDKADH